MLFDELEGFQVSKRKNKYKFYLLLSPGPLHVKQASADCSDVTSETQRAEPGLGSQLWFQHCCNPGEVPAAGNIYNSVLLWKTLPASPSIHEPQLLKANP